MPKKNVIKKKKLVRPKSKLGKRPVSRKGKAAVSKKKPAAARGSGTRRLRAPAAAKGPKENARVVAFFRIPVVAVIRVRQGTLKLGDRIWIKGHTTDLKETITSMQINHQPIETARKGAEVGVRVSSRVRRGDRIYLITP